MSIAAFLFPLYEFVSRRRKLGGPMLRAVAVLPCVLLCGSAVASPTAPTFTFAERPGCHSEGVDASGHAIRITRRKHSVIVNVWVFMMGPTSLEKAEVQYLADRVVLSNTLVHGKT